MSHVALRSNPGITTLPPIPITAAIALDMIEVVVHPIGQERLDPLVQPAQQRGHDQRKHRRRRHAPPVPGPLAESL